MELGGQEHELKMPAGSSSYGHQTPGGVLERRRDKNNMNGTTALTNQDHIHYPQRQQPRSPHPDRSNITTALTSTTTTVTIAPVSIGSNSKPHSTTLIRYRECLKNHAASVGGSVYDGCGEFMPSGEEGSIEALKCAACDCHRNFHRKEVDGETTTQFSRRISATTLMLNPLQLPPVPLLPSPNAMLHHQHQKYTTSPSSAMATPMSVAFGGTSTGGTESSSEDLNVFHSPPFALSKKRFRTKFSQEQKEKMLDFAEKVGWRINKQDEEEVERFCAEVGVKRQVFKVWMHNNKNNIVKKQQQPGSGEICIVAGGGDGSGDGDGDGGGGDGGGGG